VRWRPLQVVGSSLRVGIGILLFNGAMYALFSPSLNLSTNDQWYAPKPILLFFFPPDIYRP
jgi:hypothetical protein